MFPADFAMNTVQLTLVVNRLQDIVDDLHQTRNGLLAVRPAAFGGSSMGAFVHSHSQKAYDAISEALADNSAALLHFQKALEIAKAESHAADEGTQATMTVFHQRAEHQNTLATNCSTAATGDTTVSCER